MKTTHLNKFGYLRRNRAASGLGVKEETKMREMFEC